MLSKISVRIASKEKYSIQMGIRCCSRCRRWIQSVQNAAIIFTKKQVFSSGRCMSVMLWRLPRWWLFFWFQDCSWPAWCTVCCLSLQESCCFAPSTLNIQDCYGFTSLIQNRVSDFFFGFLFFLPQKIMNPVTGSAAAIKLAIKAIILPVRLKNCPVCSP